MKKLNELFAMSRQERIGAWIIIALIAAVLAATLLVRNCTASPVDSGTQKQVDEYIKQTGQINIKSDKAKAGKGKKKSAGKSSSKSKKKDTEKGAKKKKNDKKAKSKDATKKKGTSRKKSSQPPANRKIEPVPTF